MCELPKWLVDWAQVLGAGLSLLALVLALYALNKSKRDLAKERKHAHQLDILRDIGIILEQGPSYDLIMKLRTQLLLLPSDDLPTVRAAVRVNAPARATKEFEAKYAEKLARVAGHDLEQNLRRFEFMKNDGIDRVELDDAIGRRLRP